MHSCTLTSDSTPIGDLESCRRQQRPPGHVQRTGAASRPRAPGHCRPELEIAPGPAAADGQVRGRAAKVRDKGEGVRGRGVASQHVDTHPTERA